MGIIDTGPYKGVRGRVGNLVYYQCEGKTIVRKMPDVKPKNDSLKQRAQQSRLISAGTLFQSLKNTSLEHAWRIAAREQKLKSGYHNFIKKNSKVFGDNYEIGDFSRLQMSDGKVPLPFNIICEKIEDRKILFRWETPDFMKGKVDDDFIVVVLYDYNPFKPEIFDNTGFTRSNAYAELVINDTKAKIAHAYCLFANPQRDSFSESFYFNITLNA